MNEIFVATRSLRDVRLFMTVLQRQARDDQFRSLPMQHPNGKTGRKIALIPSFYPGVQVDPAMLAAVRSYGDAAERLGCLVEEPRLDLDFERVSDAMHIVSSLDLRIMVDSLVGGDAIAVLSELSQPYIVRWYEDSFAIDAASMLTFYKTMNDVGRSLRELANRYDVVITPATGLGPPPIDTLHNLGAEHGSVWLNQEFERLSHFCTAPNMAGLPALVVPYSISGRRQPYGIQLIGSTYSEPMLLQLAEQLDTGFVPPPGGLMIQGTH